MTNSKTLRSQTFLSSVINSLVILVFLCFSSLRYTQIASLAGLGVMHEVNLFFHHTIKDYTGISSTHMNQ